MYIVINEVEYTEVKNLSFSPEVDLTGNSIPVNQYSCDIITEDSISVGQYAYLYDDRDRLWAKYWLIEAQRVTGYVAIKAQSLIYRLDKKLMDLHLFDGETVAQALARTLNILPSGTWVLDSSLASVVLNGYAPEQTARERLLWICFVIGAYVADFFADTIEIIPIGSRQSIIPYEQTYWRPSVSYKEYVTKINIRAYTYVEGEPEVTDDWITDGSSGYYIETHEDISLSNPNVPEGMPDNELDYTDITLINNQNASDVLNRLALFYFNRAEVDLPAINNGDYKAGDKVYGYLERDSMINGYIESVSFSFGHQAKGRQAVIGVGGDINIGSVNIILLYKYGNFQIDKKTYSFPEGYAYSISTKWYDVMLNGHRYVLRPTHSQISGIASATATITENLNVALDYYQNILHIVSVDDSTQTSTGEVEIS